MPHHIDSMWGDKVMGRTIQVRRVALCVITMAIAPRPIESTFSGEEGGVATEKQSIL